MNINFKHSGQTLIEVMVTLLFLAVSIGALIKFQHYLSYDNSLAQQNSEAHRIGMSRLETMRDFQVLNNTNGYTSYQSIVSGNSTVVGTNATFTLTWTVTSYTNPTYKNVNLTVSWTDITNVAQSIQLSTNIAGVENSISASLMG